MDGWLSQTRPIHRSTDGDKNKRLLGVGGGRKIKFGGIEVGKLFATNEKGQRAGLLISFSCLCLLLKISPPTTLIT